MIDNNNNREIQDLNQWLEDKKQTDANIKKYKKESINFINSFITYIEGNISEFNNKTINEE